jgi:hypothetical protein
MILGPRIELRAEGFAIPVGHLDCNKLCSSTMYAWIQTIPKVKMRS